MKPETEVLLVAALDGLITKIDQALDELEVWGTDEGYSSNREDNARQNAEHILMNVTMELNSLIDRLTEEAYVIIPEAQDVACIKP